MPRARMTGTSVRAQAQDRAPQPGPLHPGQARLCPFSPSPEAPRENTRSAPQTSEVTHLLSNLRAPSRDRPSSKIQGPHLTQEREPDQHCLQSTTCQVTSFHNPHLILATTRHLHSRAGSGQFPALPVLSYPDTLPHLPARCSGQRPAPHLLTRSPEDQCLQAAWSWGCGQVPSPLNCV